MDYSPPGSSVHVDSPGQNSGVGCHSLLQRIFPTQGSNPGLPHCRQILDHLSHQGSPILGEVLFMLGFTRTSLIAQLVRNPPSKQETRFDCWVGKICWRRDRLPTPIFWPGEFHRLYSPLVCKEWDMTEQLFFFFCFYPGPLATILSLPCPRPSKLTSLY